ALLGGRREQRTRHELLQLLQRAPVKVRRKVEQVFLDRSLQIERRRPGRKRLRPRRPLARYSALRHRTLFDGPDGLASLSIEDVGKRLLADLNHGSNAPTVDGDVYKNWVCREVVVPEPVMDRLEMPHALSGFGFDAHEAFGKKIVAWTIRAVVVAACRRH